MAQTDNSYLESKILLRLGHLPDKKTINVLDCFGGDGTIWDHIKKRIKGKTINVTRIEKKVKPGELYLIGDNLKYLHALDLGHYDIIDLDAYGVPAKQMEILFDRGYIGVVFITFIQSIYGNLPKIFLKKLGYTSKMIKKCPAIFTANGFHKLLNYLALHGIDKVYYRRKDRKTYLMYQMEGKPNESDLRTKRESP